MTRSNVHRPDPRLDLLLERVVDVPRELVWKAWTTPEHLKKWFTPAPWTTVDVAGSGRERCRPASPARAGPARRMTHDPVGPDAAPAVHTPLFHLDSLFLRGLA